MPAGAGCACGACGACGVAVGVAGRRDRNVRNSSSVYIARSASRSGALSAHSSSLSVMGTSVLMVAKNFEKRIWSACVSTFSLSAPLSSPLCASRFSTEPYCCTSFSAVLGPTPGQPGMLSAVSPMSPSMSMTCSGS